MNSIKEISNNTIYANTTNAQGLAGLAPSRKRKRQATSIISEQDSLIFILPNEIFCRILSFLPPYQVIKFEETCKIFTYRNLSETFLTGEYWKELSRRNHLSLSWEILSSSPPERHSIYKLEYAVNTIFLNAINASTNLAYKKDIKAIFNKGKGLFQFISGAKTKFFKNLTKIKLSKNREDLISGKITGEAILQLLDVKVDSVSINFNIFNCQSDCEIGIENINKIESALMNPSITSFAAHLLSYKYNRFILEREKLESLRLRLVAIAINQADKMLLDKVKNNFDDCPESLLSYRPNEEEIKDYLSKREGLDKIQVAQKELNFILDFSSFLTEKNLWYPCGDFLSFCKLISDFNFDNYLICFYMHELCVRFNCRNDMRLYCQMKLGLPEFINSVVKAQPEKWIKGTVPKFFQNEVAPGITRGMEILTKAGHVYYGLNDFEKAGRCFEKSKAYWLSVPHEKMSCLFRQSKCFQAKGDYAKALKCFQEWTTCYSQETSFMFATSNIEAFSLAIDLCAHLEKWQAIYDLYHSEKNSKWYQELQFNRDIDITENFTLQGNIMTACYYLQKWNDCLEVGAWLRNCQKNWGSILYPEPLHSNIMMMTTNILMMTTNIYQMRMRNLSRLILPTSNNARVGLGPTSSSLDWVLQKGINPKDI